MFLLVLIDGHEACAHSLLCLLCFITAVCVVAGLWGVGVETVYRGELLGIYVL